MKSAEAIEAERQQLDSLYRAIGRFMFAFSQLEFIIRHLLGEALGLIDRRFEIVTSTYDFAKLCSVTEALYIETLGCSPEEEEAFRRIFKECKSLNGDVRVPVAHGTWFIDESSMGVRHTNREKFKPNVKFSKIAELDVQSDKADSLKSALIKLIIGPIPSTDG